MLRLLLADDEYVERQAMEMILKKNFIEIYEIEMAANGVEVVEKAKKFQPHLVFMDIKMPGCSGIEAVRKIREFLPEVNIVFITAYDYFDYAKEAIELEAEAILLKPVEIEVIINLTQRITLKIQKRIEMNEKRRKIESKFEQITKQYQEEFISMLSNFNTKPEQLEKYLKIMDIPFGCGITAVIDVSIINADLNRNEFQKGILKRRLIEKIEDACRKDEIILIAGQVGDAIKLLFVFPCIQEDNIQIIKLVEESILKGLQIVKLDLKFGVSEPVNQEFLLPNALYQANLKAFCFDENKNDNYPYKLEEECIQLIQKLDMIGATNKILEIAGVLQREFPNKTAFNREVRGLYGVVKRAIRQKISGNTNIFLQTDEHVGDVDNYTSMISFFSKIFDYLETISDKKVDKNEMLIKKVCDYVELNFNKDISLEDAANYIGFSSYYFTKLFKDYKKMSYIDFIINLRVKKAKELFDTTNMNVSEVGFAVGYEDANYFTRVFKKVEGLTPSVYKTQCVFNKQ